MECVAGMDRNVFERLGSVTPDELEVLRRRMAEAETCAVDLADRLQEFVMSLRAVKEKGLASGDHG